MRPCCAWPRRTRPASTRFPAARRTRRSTSRAPLRASGTSFCERSTASSPRQAAGWLAGVDLRLPTGDSEQLLGTGGGAAQSGRHRIDGVRPLFAPRQRRLHLQPRFGGDSSERVTRRARRVQLRERLRHRGVVADDDLGRRHGSHASRPGAPGPRREAIPVRDTGRRVRHRHVRGIRAASRRSQSVGRGGGSPLQSTRQLPDLGSASSADIEERPAGQSDSRRRGSTTRSNPWGLPRRSDLVREDVHRSPASTECDAANRSEARRLVEAFTGSGCQQDLARGALG